MNVSIEQKNKIFGRGIFINVCKLKNSRNRALVLRNYYRFFQNLFVARFSAGA